MFQDDLTRWERRHKGVSHFLSMNYLLHFDESCAGQLSQWIPGTVVDELWRLGRHQLRFVGWCEKCAVKRKEVKKNGGPSAARAPDGTGASGDRDGEEAAPSKG